MVYLRNTQQKTWSQQMNYEEMAKSITSGIMKNPKTTLDEKFELLKIMLGALKEEENNERNKSMG